MNGALRSPGGGIAVSTTERGLPVGLTIHERELGRPAAELAAEILLVCQLSAQRLQVSRRQDLVARGVSPEVIQGLDLATVDDLKRSAAKLVELDEDEGDDWSGPL
ncbi:hypothetical protein MMUR_18460 [Mycolicibacterium murale]|jgi:hypothetical protein|uniref:Uncharacterized protein n=1 Tax=Mycolicibacterium murale TaxID=182220 RepID=A0A7I9WK73_9MYCO|nr:hypothetical protein [Mycolicibacterium murale]MCV7183823.1 hypothetical protein [Mycolicibacterium murale]GFG57710.1 hypothetical protein MMUR_18460 [Mycolicibacterium murale]